MKIVNLVSIILLITWSTSSLAWPSLKVEDTIDELVTTIDGIEESFTVIRDSNRENQWYYAPTEPRLAEISVGGEKRPEFSLVRYEARDPSDPQKFIQAGLMQFSARLSLPPAGLMQLKNALAVRIGKPVEQIKLATLRMSDAKVTVYTDKGELIGEDFSNTGLAPTFATQKMAFHVPLTKLGSDVFDALVTGTTGILVSVVFDYEGLSEPLGATCTMNWENIYKFYSKDTKFAAQAKYWVFDASADIQKTKAYEELKKSKAVVCSGVGGEGFDAAKVMDTILAKINKEVVDSITPPKDLKIEEASKPKTAKGWKGLLGKFGASGGYSAKIKDINRVRKDTETYTIKLRQVLTVSSVTAGFIGIGGYSKSIRDNLVIDVASGDWGKAYLTLPHISTEIGISQVDYSASIASKSERQTATWQPGKNWLSLAGGNKTISSLAFSLFSLSEAEIKNASIEEELVITRGGDVLRFNSKRKVLNHDSVPIATPLEVVSIVSVDGFDLSFNKLDPSSPLMSVSVKLQSEDRSFRNIIRPKRIDTVPSEPDPLIWLVPRNATITPTISFKVKGVSEPIPWSGNGVATTVDSAEFMILLSDDDWK